MEKPTLKQLASFLRTLPLSKRQALTPAHMRSLGADVSFGELAVARQIAVEDDQRAAREQAAARRAAEHPEDVGKPAHVLAREKSEREMYEAGARVRACLNGTWCLPPTPKPEEPLR